ncbi:unnamed protein product, partial [Allacma fusca]
MSWFADIAGKAEDFLNKIDQNAAVALNTLEEGVGQSRSRKGSKTWAFTEDVKSETSTSYDVPTDSTISVTMNPETNPMATPLNNNTMSDTALSIKSDGFRAVAPSGLPLQAQQNKLTPVNQPSRSRSRPTTKVKQEHTEISNESQSTTTSVNGKQVKTDEELLEFLNSPGQKEIDESALLKSELATQSKEMGMVLKNYKKLQQDFDRQSKTTDELRKSLNDQESRLSSEESNNVQEISRLKEEKEKKNAEINQLQQRLDETLEKLKGMDKLLELQNRVEHLDLENRQLASKNMELDDKTGTLNNQLIFLEKQAQSAKEALAVVENDFSVYKEKAKSILKSKDELIVSIKNQNSSSKGIDGSFSSIPTDAQVMAEIGSLKNERELLHGEISQSRSLCDSLKDENRRLESDLQSLRSNLLELQEICSRDRNISHSIQEENLQLSQKVSSLQLEVEREKSEKRKLDEKVQKLANDNELGFSIATRSSSGSTNDFTKASSLSRMNMSPVPSLGSMSSDNFDERENLKTRIKALSQSLMEKQSLINNISADKQLLQIRVERMQAQIQELTDSSESNSHGGLTQTVISSQPLYLSESPWDSGVTTRVKRVYSRVDSLCCQFGLAMRHRPNLRL